MAIGLTGQAQQSATFKVKSSAPKKEKQSAPLPLPTANNRATTSSARDLQAVERQAAKPAPSRSAPSQAAGKKTAPALTSAKGSGNPPINFRGNGAAKKSGLTNQGSDPYAGRLRGPRN